jgi:hypothetical protein
MSDYLCISNYYNAYTFALIFVVGEIYQTSFRNDHMANGIYIQRKDCFYDVRFKESDIKNYFITLAEFREQQIKTILDV